MLQPADSNNEAQQANYRRQLKEMDTKYGAYTWGGALGVSAVFIALMVGLGAWRFAVRDY